ncbi:MAG: crossover junction endodeoxyribonuclease RuvC [Asticcacaulis sp.]
MSESPVRILGLDPGLRRLGWGVIDACGPRLRWVAHGVIEPPQDEALAVRLLHLYDALTAVVETWRPEEAAIEETFVNMNPTSTLKLGHARAAAMLAPAKVGLSVAEYAALDIKKSVVGAGRADKEQILFMVKRLLPLSATAEGGLKADAADALACAITHAHKRKMATLKRTIQLAPAVRSTPGSESALSRAAAGPTRLPYTLSSATEGGWMWRIPLQHRIGNGHVFSSSFIDEDKAADILIRSVPGKALADPRLVRFRTGRRERFWEKNVAAVGLSGGFIEPLESTSIYFIQSSIQKLLSHWPDRTFSPANIALYNQRLIEDYDHVRDVIILHYHLTERDDAPLWDHVRTMTVPDSLQSRIDVFRERGMIANRPDEMFSATSWLAIMIGQGVEPRGYGPLMDGQDKGALAGMFAQIRERIKSAVEPLPSQDELLKYHGLIS